MSTAAATFIEAQGVRWTAHEDDTQGSSLHGVDLRIEDGEFVALTGSLPAARTLLRMLAGLLRPDGGRLTVGDVDLVRGEGEALVRHRRRVGAFLGDSEQNLVPGLTVRENLELPLRLRGVPRDERTRRVQAVMSRLSVEMAEREGERWSEREWRLTALASALVTEAPLLLFEEPTRGLDAQSANDVLQLLRERAERGGATVLVAAQDGPVLTRAPRSVLLRDGRVVGERTRRMAFSRGEGERIDEFAAVDRQGRVALPAEALQALGIAERAVVVRADDHIELRADRPPPSAPERAWRRP